jgi:SRSO17 transposase
MRWSIEQSFKECKTNLGMDHYQTRMDRLEMAYPTNVNLPAVSFEADPEIFYQDRHPI